MSGGEPIRIRTAGGVVEVPPCPAWCELPAAHHLGLYLEHGVDDYAGIDREHSAALVIVEAISGPVGVEIAQAEDVASGYSDPPAVVACEQHLTADQARALANALRVAASRLDGIAAS